MPPVPAWRRTPRHRPRPKGQSTKRRRRPITPKRDGAAARPSRPTGRRRRTGRSTSPKGSQLILATNMATTPSDQPTFAATILAMEHTIGLPHTVLADAGFASGAAVAKLEAKNVEPLVAIARTQPHRPYDFRPPPKPKLERRIRKPWRLAMKAKLESEEGKSRYKNPGTRNANRPSNRSSASSRAPSDLPASTFVVARKSPPSGSSSPSPITAAASAA